MIATILYSWYIILAIRIYRRKRTVFLTLNNTVQIKFCQTSNSQRGDQFGCSISTRATTDHRSNSNDQ